MAVPNRATASIQPVYCTNCIQCVPMDRPLRSSSLETIEASDALPKQVSSTTMWFPNCIWNCITLSCTLHNKASGIIHRKHRRTKQPHPDLACRYRSMTSAKAHVRKELSPWRLKKNCPLGGGEKKEKIKKIIGIIQRDNGQEFNIILQRQPQIQEPQIIPSRITNNKIKWNRKKEHLNMLYKIVEHQREKNRLENNQIKDRWFTKGRQFYSLRQ